MILGLGIRGVLRGIQVVSTDTQTVQNRLERADRDISTVSGNDCRTVLGWMVPNLVTAFALALQLAA